MKNIIKIIIIVILCINFSCRDHLEFKELINVPPNNFCLSDTILKSNGYFYCEKEKTSYCESQEKGSGMESIPESKFVEKYLSIIILYKNGVVIHPRNTIFSGIVRNNEDYFNYCDKLAEYNNYKSAIEVFESLIEENCFDNRNKGIYSRGVYNLIENKKIKFQIYHGWISATYTSEYLAEILNDSTFQINYIKTYESNEIKEVNEVYHFRQLEQKPDSTSYILDNREKFGK
jgi:hypothetical protein